MAERHGVSVAVVRAAEKRFAADASDLDCERAIVGEQLSRIAHTFYGRAIEGDARCAELMLEISRRRSELLGLYVPRTLRLEDQRPPEHQPSTTDRIEAALRQLAATRDGGTADGASTDDGDNQLN